MDVAIQSLTDADVDAVVAFSLDAWAPVFAGFAQVMGPRVFGLVHPDWRTAQAAAQAEVCRSLDAWVADVDGTPVGFVAVRWTQEDATPVGEVDMIAVAPGHQRAGIASRLVARAVAEIAGRGCRSPSSVPAATTATPRPAPATSGTGSPACRWCATTARSDLSPAPPSPQGPRPLRAARVHRLPLGRSCRPRRPGGPSPPASMAAERGTGVGSRRERIGPGEGPGHLRRGAAAQPR
ncbi:GNAT family N-acetyltransferase [Geodermatophilus obscurus]|uniref:GNAT family N-acetyltransferase n=1 Tax=Geodermatophilus obscurus TaxID=1861 RepID=UPI001AD94652|nr:GNAT family N-acetyltransferase [Geodermatophilus obscurus]